MNRSCHVLRGLGFFLLTCGRAAGGPESIQWSAWSPQVFEQAEQEHRFVLLDLEAVWCHWCHVMDETTYANPAVIALVKSNYIAVRVDQDSRPDLAGRYEDYGWPATIVFNDQGGEIVKRRGYLPPPEMIAMLKAIVADPSPGPSVRPEEKINFQPGLGLTAGLRAELRRKLVEGYDRKMGAWGFDQKFMNCDNVEYCMAHAKDDGGLNGRMARETLTAQLQLIDPAWGGVYQYSTDDDWKHPHFEKIMEMQAGDMRLYALAYARWHDEKYKKAALAIDRYLATFLTSPEGAFYTSQDADLIDGEHAGDYFKLGDKARRKKGIPRIDRHIYARENGCAIEALTTLYWVTGDATELGRALRAANWIVANRALYDGGFRHDATDSAGPYLSDTLAMARGFLALYQATADGKWLGRAEKAMQFIGEKFAAEPGFVTAGGESKIRRYGENVAVARLANLLFHFTGRAADRAMAEGAMKWVAAPEISGRRFADVGGALLADEELNNDPIHLTIIGKKDDPMTRLLWKVALAFPSTYRRVEWFETGKGLDTPYPALPFAAAFLCTQTTCSTPMKTPEALAQRIRRLVE